MNIDPESNKRELIGSYLSHRGFTDVRVGEGLNVLYSMTANGRDYQLRVEREWLDLPSTDTIHDRLERLQLIPFLRENSAAWLGVTATGQEIVTHVDGQARV